MRPLPLNDCGLNTEKNGCCCCWATAGAGRLVNLASVAAAGMAGNDWNVVCPGRLKLKNEVDWLLASCTTVEKPPFCLGSVAPVARNEGKLLNALKVEGAAAGA